MHYRAIFLSDLHLGFTANRSDLLLDFLKHNSCAVLYLVGDIIDIWELERKFHWSWFDSCVIQKLLEWNKSGTKIFYVPGNHDTVIRRHLPLKILGIEFANEFTYEAVNGKRYLVIHGDLFDSEAPVWEWLSRLGNRAYDVSIQFNRFVNVFRNWAGAEPWSVSLYVKQNVKKAINYIISFEKHMINYCKKGNYDGAICGHIHCATIRDMDGLIYMNAGDWIESYTALVENFDGKFEIVKWNRLKNDNQSNDQFNSQNH